MRDTADPGIHVPRFEGGPDAWNQWRRANAHVRPDLRGARLQNRDLRGYDLSGAVLTRADLRGAIATGVTFYGTHGGASLGGADLDDGQFQCADLTRAWLVGATGRRARFDSARLQSANFGGFEVQEESSDFTEARFIDADLSWATMWNVCVEGADFSGANLSHARLTRVQLRRACMSGCQVYGIACWDVDLEDAQQNALRITPADQPDVTADDLQVAQFLYLLLNNAKLRDVLDAISSKTVLILGRFSPDRKAVLDAIRTELRRLGFVSVVVDFHRPKTRDLTQVVTILANLAAFVVADLSNPRSLPHELATIVPTLRTVPVVPILEDGSETYGMFGDLAAYPWVLPVVGYRDGATLVEELDARVVRPAMTVRLKLPSASS